MKWFIQFKEIMKYLSSLKLMVIMMVKEYSKRKDMNYDEVLQHLLKDPTRSIHDIAEEMGSYRQKVWRKKKRFEEEGAIWGYTAVLDESKLNHVCYMVLLKTKPISRGFADLLLKRLIKDEPKREDIRIISLCYVSGEYDLVMRFAAPNHTIAKKYYDNLRLLYDEYLLEKPTLLFSNFCMISEGKLNPEVNKLYDFIP